MRIGGADIRSNRTKHRRATLERLLRRLVQEAAEDALGVLRACYVYVFYRVLSRLCALCVLK